MSIFTDSKRYRENIRARAAAEAEVARLKAVQVQLSNEILSIKTETEPRYAANYYTDYATSVKAISDKYSGIAKFGVLQTGNIIDLRAAFIMAEGLTVKPAVRGEGKEEMAFVDKFLQYNGLDPRTGQTNAYEFAKEAEIEGKILLRLFWEESDVMVSVRYVSWTSKKYVVKANPSDYLDYESVSWKEDDKDVTVKWPDFVYHKFGGRINEPNTAAPKIMKCLTKIDDLDWALRDFREINRLFAAPVFTIIFETAADAKKAQEDIDKMNWKIKKALCTNGDPRYIQPSLSGIESLEREIVNIAKMISGSTGVPVHFLGLPDLLSNRATADNLMELIFASTAKERETWKTAYSELISQSMVMFNEKTGLSQKTTALNPEKITVDIPFVSEKVWAQLEKVLLPLSIAGKISDELILSKIPGVDVDAELERKEKKGEENDEFTKTNSKNKIPFTEDEFDQRGGES